MEKESNETRELKKMKLHVFNIDMEVNVPAGEEQRYREAAEMVNRKIKAYREVSSGFPRGTSRLPLRQ